MTKQTKHTDVDKESLRLEYCFEKGINFKDRVIQITGEIEENSSFDWLDAALTEMERDSRKKITIKINSPGGSVYEALAMVDRIQQSKCHITTICYGHAMSAASLLLAAGNSRYIGKRSWVMYHQISSGTHGTLSEVQEFVEQLNREMKLFTSAMSEFTKKPIEFWESVAHKHDFFMNADECLEAGVVDGIL